MSNIDLIASLGTWDLQIIVTIAERGTLVAAAQALNVSPSSISRVISRLQKRLAVVLFVRTARRMELTPSGQELVAIAERILDDLRLASANLREGAAEKHGQVRISSFPQFAREILPPIIAAYRKDRIKTEIHIRSGSNLEVIKDVHSGLADIGITFGDATPRALDSLRLRRDVLCAFIPAGHELATAATPLPFVKLDGMSMVSLPRETYTRKLVDEAATAARITLNNTVTVPGFVEQMACTRAGMGISLVPSSMMPDVSPREVIVRAVQRPQLNVSITMVSFGARRMSFQAASFKDMLVEAMRSAAPRVWNTSRVSL